MRDRVVSTVIFDSYGVQITYVNPKVDAKSNGLLVNHTLLIPFDEDYDDEIEAIMDAVHAALDDALDDFDKLEGLPEPAPEEPDDDNDDDDDDEAEGESDAE